MRILAFIEDKELIEKILEHPGLWDLKVRLPPKAKAPSVTISIDDSDSQVPFSAPSFYPDPRFPMDSCGISKRYGVAPMVTISSMSLPFPTSEKGEDLISIYSPGIHVLSQ